MGTETGVRFSLLFHNVLFPMYKYLVQLKLTCLDVHEKMHNMVI